ncbi:MAG TPA: lipopolysaccharide biosynthesis protein [Burkholderiales bacterium]|nr:lipopolysaccharide biosynthesis protein [Burkholderiales bacterium]
MQLTLRHQILAGLRWSAGVRLASQLFTWAVTLVVVRLLSPQDYGLLSMAMVFVGFISMVAEFGLGPAIVQKTHVSDAELRKVFGLVIVIHGSLCVLLALAAPLIAAFFVEPRLTLLVRVLTLVFMISAFQVMPNALLQRQMEFRRRSLNDFTATILGSTATLAAALLGWGVWALVAGSFVAQAWKSVGLNRIMPYLRWPDLRIVGVRHLLVFGGHMSITNVLWFLFSQADAVIGGKWLGKELLGFYTVAAHLASLPNQRISGIINQVAFPAFARMQDDVPRVGANVLKGVRILSFVSFPILWGLGSVAPEFVSVILGAKWQPAVPTLMILALIMPLRMISNFVPNAIQGVGRSDIVLKTVAFATVVTPVAFLVGVQWGLIGLSLAWVASVPVVFVFSMSRGLPAVGLRIPALLCAMARPAVAASIMVAAVTIARFLLEARLSAPWTLAALVAVGVAGYLTASLLFNREGTREARSLAASLFAGGSANSGGESADQIESH